MDDLRYPIGPFTPSGDELTEEGRKDLVDSIAGHPARMRALVEGLDDAQLDTPYREGGWTVRQVVHHVVDSHMNGYVRFKLGATEERPTIGTYDQDRWARSVEAATGPVDLSLPLLDALHHRWVAFLRTLDPAHWRRTVRHPEMETDPTLDTLLELYGWHCLHHEGHIASLRSRMDW